MRDKETAKIKIYFSIYERHLEEKEVESGEKRVQKYRKILKKRPIIKNEVSFIYVYIYMYKFMERH